MVHPLKGKRQWSKASSAWLELMLLKIRGSQGWEAQPQAPRHVEERMNVLCRARSISSGPVLASSVLPLPSSGSGEYSQWCPGPMVLGWRGQWNDASGSSVG